MHGDTNELTKAMAHHSHRGHADGAALEKDLMYMKTIQHCNPGEIIMATRHSY